MEGIMLHHKDVDDKKEEILKLQYEILDSVKMNVEKAIHIGELLLGIKGELGHGKWGNWVGENLPFTPRTAERYMSLTRIKNDNVSDLSLFDALKLLPHKLRPATNDEPEAEEVPEVEDDMETPEPEAEVIAEVPKEPQLSKAKVKALAKAEADARFKITSDRNAHNLPGFKSVIELLSSWFDSMKTRGQHWNGDTFDDHAEWVDHGVGKIPVCGELRKFVEDHLEMLSDMAGYNLVPITENPWPLKKWEPLATGKVKTHLPKYRQAKKGINRKTKANELFDVLDFCFRFTSKREFISTGFKCFRFQGRKVYAFNKDTGIEMTLPEGYDFKECFVLADFFLATLKEFVDVEVTFRVEEDKMLLIKDGEVIACILTSVPEEDYNFPEVPHDSRFKSLPEGFLQAIDQIWFAAMRDPISFNKLSAIFVDGKSMYATNNIVLAKLTTDFNFDGKFIIPDDLLGDGKKHPVFWGKKSKKHPIFWGEAEVNGYCVEEQKFWVKGSKFKAFANAIRRPLDIDRLKASFDDFPKDAPVCEYDPIEVLNSMKRIRSWTYGTSKRMTFELNGKMLFSAQNDIGSARSEASCRYSGEPIPPFTFGYNYLSDCIKRAKAFSVTMIRGRARLYFKEANLELLLISFKNP